MKNKRYEYLVSCIVTKGEEVVYNSIQATTTYKLNSFDKLNKLVEMLKQSPTFKDCSLITVMNFKLLRSFRNKKVKDSNTNLQEVENQTEATIQE